MTKIIPIQTISTESVAFDTDDKHLQFFNRVNSVLLANRKPAQKNLTPVPVHHATRSSKVALLLVPMWGPQIAPYGIARLAGLARHQGFDTRCWDLNAKCYDRNKNLWGHLDDWKWSNFDLYHQDLHPVVLPVLEQFLDELVEFNPDVIGFTMYYTNLHCASWLIKRIKERLPNAMLVAGGPNARNFNESTEICADLDYVVRGEGELIFSQLLEDIDNGNAPSQKFFDHDKKIRIDLDSMPVSDYRDFDFNLYQFKGMANELSRGCIAKCTFCSETTFWKYRGRVSTSVLDEVEYNYRTYGIEFVWFIDSLINGNLKELLAFAQGLIDRDIKIQWWGFARCDERMDRAYLKTLLDSGLLGFHIGIESGSQKVVDLIEKKVQISEVEQNLNDLAELGSFYTGTSWFVGFPGEELTDSAQSLTLVWRLRNSGVDHKGFGFCSLGPDAPITLHREKYNISNGHVGGQWFTNDYRNTIAHRVIRYKSVCILQNHYRLHNVRNEHLGKQGEQTGFLDHYTLKYNVNNWVNSIDYDFDFEYNIIEPDINPLADSLVNEMWPLLRVLWQAMGTFSLEVKFDPSIDRHVYGSYRYFSDDSPGLWANYKFEIDKNGNWAANFYTRLDTVSSNDASPNFEHTWSGTGTWDRQTPCLLDL